MSGSPVKATKRQAKALLKNQQSAQIDAEIPELEDAAKIIAKLRKDYNVMKKKVDGQAVIIGKLWKWKGEQERRGK